MIYGVIESDWHYYLLIAPHSNSSPFEDQSDRVPLCADTDKPRVNFNKANCSLCTSVAPDPLSGCITVEAAVLFFVYLFMMIAEIILNSLVFIHFEQSLGYDFLNV